MEGVPKMEVTEGNVRVEHVEVVMIGDVPLDKCSPRKIRRELLSMIRRIAELRAEVEALKGENDAQD